jgi:hypothetical protein
MVVFMICMQNMLDVLRFIQEVNLFVEHFKEQNISTFLCRIQHKVDGIGFKAF